MTRSMPCPSIWIAVVGIDIVTARMSRSKLPDVADERRPSRTQALEDRRSLHDNLAARRRVAPQLARGCRRHPVAALITPADPLGQRLTSLPHAAAGPSPCPDARAYCDVAAWHVGHSVGHRSVTATATDHQTVPDIKGERWIEKSTHWSREDRL